MALLWMDGFDAADCNAKGYIGTWQASAGTGPNTRFGTGRWAGVTNATVAKRLDTPINKIYTGMAWGGSVVDATGSRPRILIGGDGGGTYHLGVTINNGNINLHRGNFASYIAGAAGNFVSNVFYYLEIAATIHDTTGTCEVRVNGNTVINYTGDTRNGGGTTIDSVFFSSYAGYYTYVDDFYICDDTGPAPHNNFLGDVRVHTMSPTADGTTIQFTPSSGANYTTVDELPGSTADYVSANTSGTKDTYQMADLPASAATIFGVQTNVLAKKMDAGSIALKPIIRSGGTDYSGSTTSLSTYDVTLTDLRPLDPNTSSVWDAAGVNGIEAGMEIA